MSVKIAIEGPADEVEAALSITEGVLQLVYVERNQWDIPEPTVRVTVDASVPPEPLSEA